MAEPAAIRSEPSGDDPSAELRPEHDRDAKPYAKMIEHAERVFDQWYKTCDVMAKAYASLERLAKTRVDREFQIFAANLEVVKPSVYSRPPQPVVVPRFKDRKPVPRKTSEMLERALATSFDTEKVHETIKKVRDDLCLTGRGVIWARYAMTKSAKGPTERVAYEWVHRRDFLHEPVRIWSEVGWVARGSWLTQEQGEERFGKAWKAGEISYEEAADTAEDYKVEKKARVWELWHRDRNLVVWLHPNSKEVLDISEPHLMLEGFYPCPKPAYATCEDDSLIPVPDGLFYKDQLEEINELTARISALAESLKLAVFYPAGQEELGAAIEAALAELSKGDNRRLFQPLAGLGQFNLSGAKLADALWQLPVQDVAITIKELVALRKQLIDDVYQISGVSDIMRGETEASETLGAQQLKSQYGSIRIKDRQSEMVRICDNVLNIGGEIMAENFQPQTLLEMSQTELPKQADVLAEHQQAMAQEIQAAVQQVQQGMAQGQPPPDLNQIAQAKQAIQLKHQKEVAEVVTVEQVFHLLSSQRMRPFILQIATDSTIQPDENAEKQRRAEFGAAFAQTMTALGPLVQAAPAESADFAGEMLKFQLAPYRAGRAMEQSIDELVEKLKEKAKQPPPPSPEQIKAEAEAKKLELDNAKSAKDLEDKAAERAHKEKVAAADIADRQQDRAHKERLANSDLTLKDKDIAIKDRDLALKDKELALKEKDARIKDVEHGVRVREAAANEEMVADKREERRHQSAQKLETDSESHRTRKLSNDKAEMDIEDRQEERTVRRNKEKRETDKEKRDVMQSSEVTEAIKELVNAISTMNAEKEVVRDPKTGRATGVRIKKTNGAV